MKKISDKKIMIIHDLYQDGYSERQISKLIHLSRSTVSKYLKSNKFAILKFKNKLNSFNTIRKIDIRKELRANARIEEESLTSNPLNNVAENNNVISYSDSQSAKSNLIKSKSTNSIREAPTETKSNVSNPTFNPVNNVSKASPVSSPTSNSTPAKNQPTFPTISTQPKTPENTDNTKLSNWDSIKSYLKGALKNWFKNILDDIDLKIHHNYEDRP